MSHKRVSELQSEWLRSTGLCDGQFRASTTCRAPLHQDAKITSVIGSKSKQKRTIGLRPTRPSSCDAALRGVDRTDTAMGLADSETQLKGDASLPSIHFRA